MLGCGKGIWCSESPAVQEGQGRVGVGCQKGPAHVEGCASICLPVLGTEDLRRRCGLGWGLAMLWGHLSPPEEVGAPETGWRGRGGFVSLLHPPAVCRPLLARCDRDNLGDTGSSCGKWRIRDNGKDRENQGVPSSV